MDVTLIRGGTSKGVFVRLRDLPPDPAERDGLALRLLGSPDPMQLDGLGSAHPSTSKLMAVGTADEARARGWEVPDGTHVVSLFGQVHVERPLVEWHGNCGNLTAGVGVFAVHEGLVCAVDPEATVSLFNLNTATPITIRLPVEGGRPRSAGDFVLAGVPGRGARIDVTFHARATTTPPVPLFPTGQRVDRVDDDTGSLDVTVLHVGRPFVLVRAASLGLRGSELPTSMQADDRLHARVDGIRAEIADRLGTGPQDSLPALVLVSEPHEHQASTGETVAAGDADLVARMISLDRFHHALSGTGLLATSIAARVPGTVVDGIVAGDGHDLRLAHPKGVVTTVPEIVDPTSDNPAVRSVTLASTARRLLAGVAEPGPPR